MIRFSLILFFITAPSVYGGRDPFWPIDHVPTGEVVPEEDEKPEPPPPGLTEEELRQRVELQIKEALNRKATVISNGRISALVNGKLVSQGDTLPIKSGGKIYKLKVKILTTDNIVLELVP